MGRTVTEVEPRPEEIVYFVVLCRPKTGASITEFRQTLRLENIKKLTPEEATRTQVITDLKSKGFTLYTQDPSPVVAASGTVGRFEEIFSTKLVKYIQKDEETGFEQEYFGVAANEKPPNAEAVAGAMLIEIQRMPEPCAVQSPLPPLKNAFHVRHPGEIAILTRAARVHRLKTPVGQRATGEGVVVAMVDTGVSLHPFYEGHGYDLRFDKASDVTVPADQDNSGHGTRHTAAIFSCAPDATVIGIKMGNITTLPFDRAKALGAKVVNYSYIFRMNGLPDLGDYLGLETTLLTLIDAGITIVVSGGNKDDEGFPAMMDKVIAVGGVTVDKSINLKASGEVSSYRAAIYRGRAVPDLCGISSLMALPNSALNSPTTTGWTYIDGQTSDASAQVAGVAALLVQKKPALTPAQIKTALVDHGQDVPAGTTKTGDTAVPGGPDLATGGGLVDALAAWQSV
jgi:hypothetical protein